MTQRMIIYSNDFHFCYLVIIKGNLTGVKSFRLGLELGSGHQNKGLTSVCSALEQKYFMVCPLLN